MLLISSIAELVLTLCTIIVISIVAPVVIAIIGAGAVLAVEKLIVTIKQRNRHHDARRI